MAKGRFCKICEKPSQFLSGAIGVCRSCIRDNPKDAVRISLENHGKARRGFDLPGRIPRSPSGYRAKSAPTNVM